MLITFKYHVLGANKEVSVPAGFSEVKGWCEVLGRVGVSYPHSLSSKEGTFLDAHGEVTDKVMINSATLTARVQ